MLNCISGRYRPTSGRVVYKGRDITHSSANKRAGLGLGRTFQNLALFNGMSVLDNISVGRHHLMKAGFARGMIYWVGGARREEAEHRAAVEEIIDFLRDPEHPQRAGRRALLRPAQARRARTRDRPEARPHPARRADGRHEPRGEGGHGPLHRRSQRGVGHDGGHDRARHGRGHGPLAPLDGARLRPQDRRGPAGRDQGERGRAARLPRRGSRPFSAPEPAMEAAQ